MGLNTPPSSSNSAQAPDFPVIQPPPVKAERDTCNVDGEDPLLLNHFESAALWLYQGNTHDFRYLITTFEKVLKQFIDLHNPKKFTLSLPNDWKDLPVNLSPNQIIEYLVTSRDLTKSTDFFSDDVTYTGSFRTDNKEHKFVWVKKGESLNTLNDHYVISLNTFYRYVKYREAELQCREKRLANAIMQLTITLQLVPYQRTELNLLLVKVLESLIKIDAWRIAARLVHMGRFSPDVDPFVNPYALTLKKIPTLMDLGPNTQEGVIEYVEALADYSTVNDHFHSASNTLKIVISPEKIDKHREMFSVLSATARYQTGNLHTSSILKLCLAIGFYSGLSQPPLVKKLVADNFFDLQYFDKKFFYVRSGSFVDLNILRLCPQALLYDTFFYIAQVKRLGTDQERVALYEHLATELKLSRAAILYGLLTGDFSETQHQVSNHHARFTAWVNHKNYELAKPWIEHINQNSGLAPTRELVFIAELYYKSGFYPALSVILEPIPTVHQSTILTSLKDDILKAIHGDVVLKFLLTLLPNVDLSLGKSVYKVVEASNVNRIHTLTSSLPINNLIPVSSFLNKAGQYVYTMNGSTISKKILSALPDNINLIPAHRTALRKLYPDYYEHCATTQVQLLKPEAHLVYWTYFSFAVPTEVGKLFASPQVLSTMIESQLNHGLDKTQAAFIQNVFITGLGSLEKEFDFPQANSKGLFIEILKKMKLEVYSALVSHLTLASIDALYLELTDEPSIDKNSAAWAVFESRRESLIRAAEDKKAQELALPAPTNSVGIAPAPEPAPVPAPAPAPVSASAPVNEDEEEVEEDEEPAPDPAPAPVVTADPPPPAYTDTPAAFPVAPPVVQDPDLQRRHNELVLAYEQLSARHERLQGKQKAEPPAAPVEPERSVEALLSDLLDRKLEPLQKTLRFSVNAVSSSLSSSSTAMDDKQRIAALEDRVANLESRLKKLLKARRPT